MKVYYLSGSKRTADFAAGIFAGLSQAVGKHSLLLVCELKYA